MPVFYKPVVASTDKKQHHVIPDGGQIDSALVPVAPAPNFLENTADGLAVRAASMVSKTADNLLSVGVDDKLYVASPTASDILSKDANNYLRYGSDKGLYVGGNDILSNDANNLLGISTVDGKIMLEATSIGVSRSADADNLLGVGTDGGMYLAGSFLISSDAGNTLTLGSDKKLYTHVVSSTAGNVIKADAGDKGAALLLLADTLSRNANNKLKLGTDNLLFVTPADFVQASATNPLSVVGGYLQVRLVSADTGNLATLGSDGAVLVKLDNVRSSDTPNVLTVGTDGKLLVSPQVMFNPSDKVLSANAGGLITTLDMAYNVLTGKLDITGNGGQVVTSVTIPSSVSMLESTRLVIDPVGYPAGTYFEFTFRLADNTTRTELVNMSAFSDTYKSGKGIGISADNTISVAFDTLSPFIFDSNSLLTMDFNKLLSVQPGNILSLGVDGKLFVTTPTVSAADYNPGSGIRIDVGTRTISVAFDATSPFLFDTNRLLALDYGKLISAQNNNQIVVGADGKLFVDADDYKPGKGVSISSDKTISIAFDVNSPFMFDANSLLTIDNNKLVSAGANNLLSVNIDGKLFVDGSAFTKASDYTAGPGIIVDNTARTVAVNLMPNGGLFTNTLNQLGVNVGTNPNNPLFLAIDGSLSIDPAKVPMRVSAQPGNLATLGIDGGIMVSTDYGTMG